MEGDVATVDAYVAGLPDERREAISAVREAVNVNLAESFEEMMLYGCPAGSCRSSATRTPARVSLEAIGHAIAQASVERHIAAYERSRG